MRMARRMTPTMVKETMSVRWLSEAEERLARVKACAEAGCGVVTQRARASAAVRLRLSVKCAWAMGISKASDINERTNAQKPTRISSRVVKEKEEEIGEERKIHLVWFNKVPSINTGSCGKLKIWDTAGLVYRN